MSLTLVFGSAGTGKSEYCVSSMATLLQKGCPSLMIVPEQFAHSAETRLIEKNGFLSDDILATSFKRLAHKVQKKVGGQKEYVTKVGKSMLVSKAILGLENSLTLYKSAATKPGFCDLILTFIAECKRSAIEPDRLLAYKETGSPYLSMKVEELGKIYAAYEDALGKEWIDSDDDVTRLARQVGASGLCKGLHIYIDEFFRFTPAEYDCILAFLAAGAEVTVTLSAPGPGAGGIFAPVTQTANHLCALCRENGFKVNEPILLKEKFRFYNSKELLHFENEYHHYPPTIYMEETHDISLYVAPDLYTETQILAAKIKKIVMEKGLRYNQVAVIAGDPEQYRDLIEAVFPLYDIPVFMDKKETLLSHPIIVMLLSLFDLMTGGFDTQTLIRYMKTNYSGLSLEEADRLENFVLAGNIKREDWLNDSRFLKQAQSIFYGVDDLEEEDTIAAEELLSLRNRLIDPLKKLFDNLREDKTVSQRAKAFLSFFEDISLEETVEKEIGLLNSLGQMQKAAEHAEVYQLLLDLFDQLVLCFEEEKIGLKRLQTILCAGLSQCETATIPPGTDQVLFGDVSRSLIKNVKALFVIGATSAFFPAAPAQSSLIKDDERNLLEKMGLVLGPDSKKLSVHNEYLVYSALNVATDRLDVSYSVADFDGKGLRPSPLVNRLRKLFPKLATKDHLLTPPTLGELVKGKNSAWQYLLEHYRDNSAETAWLKDVFKKDEEFAPRLLAIKRHSEYTHKVNRLPQTAATRLYGKNLKTSITRLETFSRCPFSYFIQYGLKAKERKVLKVEAVDVGHLLHQLVELASRQITEQKLRFADLATDEKTLREIADQTVDNLLSTLFVKHLYAENRFYALVHRLKIRLYKMLKVICIHIAQGEFEPCAFEVAFDEQGEFPPVTITLPTGETITIVGRIDRIDTMKKGANVYVKIIDYKSGNKQFRLSDIYNRLSLQLAVYITAVEESSFLGENIKPAGVFYFRLVDKTVNATEEQAEKAMLNQFKMSGLLLQDADIIRCMDKGISGWSSIIPARIKQDGELAGGKGTSYATMKQFKKLSAYIRRVAGELGREILQGNIAISPCKNGDSLPCDYCRFHSICSHQAEKDPVRIAPPFKEDAVWALLDNEVT